MTNEPFWTYLVYYLEFFPGCYTSLLCHDLCDDCIMLCSLTVTDGSFGQQVLALLMFLLQSCTVSALRDPVVFVLHFFGLMFLFFIF